MTTVAEKVAEKMGKPDGMPTDVFFKNNKTAARVLSNVMAKAEIAKNKTMMMAAKGGYVGYANGGTVNQPLVPLGGTNMPTDLIGVTEVPLNIFDDVSTKTPEELAEEERQRVIALQKTAITGQQNLVANVSSDPSQIVAQPTVATIDPNAAGRLIDPTAGQVTAPVPQAGQPDFFKQIQQPFVLDKNGKPQKVREPSGAKRQIDFQQSIISDIQKELTEYDKRMAEVRPAMNQAIQNSPEFKAKETFLQTFAGREPTQAEIEQFKKLDFADKNSPARQQFVDFQQNLMQSLGLVKGGDGVVVSSRSPSGVARTTTAAAPDAVTSETVDAKTASGEVTTALADVDPVTGAVSDAAKVTAATMDPTTTGVKDLTAAQGEAVVMTNPVQREIQDGELVSGAADATKAAAFTEQVQAATATPSEKATVQGQLSTLMADFEGGETPAWAAGAMRAANAAMAARGLGASSMAGQAVVQAAMESALPIAMADAQTTAGFEMQNLSNRQQRAMLAAQQRATFMGQEFDQAFQARVSNAAKISDVANMNFTAEQQVALENSRNANTVNLTNLTNKQAMVLAEASAISQLESQNLSNQQQAAVQNANSFLQVDMANMNNEQQTTMFKAQSVVQSLLTDQAAENAARQFNASSENQTKQFMANLNTQVTQFNAAQTNAISQFNAGEENALDKFNASMEEQRNQFNAQNGLVVAQANAQWRQNVDTLNTAAQNEANMINAATINTFTKSAVDQIWQRERDLMDYAFKGSEQEKDRMVNIMLGEKQIDQYRTQSEQTMKSNEDTAKYSILTRLILDI